MGNTDSIESISFVSQMSDNDHHITHAETRTITSMAEI